MRASYSFQRPSPAAAGREPCLRLNEIADRLDMSEHKLHGLLRRYGIKTTGMGRGRTYHLSDFQNAINQEKGETVYVVRKGVPLPPVNPRRSAYAEPLAKVVELEPGSMIEMPDEIAKGVMLIVRREHQMLKFATRNMGNGMRGIWRLA